MNTIVPDDAGWFLDEYDAERFWSRVNLHGGTAYEQDPLANAAGECWVWTGAINGGGYGWFRLFGRDAKPHRIAYRDFGNKLPDELEIDHLCRNKACVNPAHLEAVTHQENVSRGVAGNRTHCPHGHEYSPENTTVFVRNGREVRYCSTCLRESQRKSNIRYAQKQKQKQKQV